MDNATEKLELIVAATVRPVEETEVDSILAAVKDADDFEQIEASLPAMLNGKPRVLSVEGWIVHEGTNENSNHFIGEELREQVETHRLFGPPHFGIIDYNHDMHPIGLWYSSEYRYDEAAGKHGIYARGAIWAWRFPRQAQQILDNQALVGTSRFSIGVLSARKDIEYRRIDGKLVGIVHNPSFFGATALVDEQPGDPAALGTVEEANQPSADLLLAASLVEDQVQDPNLIQEENMDELKELVANLRADVSEEAIAAITAAVTPLVEGIRADLAARTTEVETLTARAEGAEAQVGTLEAAVLEKDTVIAALTSEKESLEATIASLTTEVDAFKAEAETRAIAARKEARIAEVPEAIRKRVEALPVEQSEKIVLAWTNASDDEWAVKLEELKAVAPATTGDRPLPNSPTEPKSLRNFLRTQS